MKKRKIIAGLIAQKFLKDLDAILDGFNIEQQIHITETLKKIYKIIIEPKNNEKPYNLRYKKADKIYNEELLKRYGKLFVKANSINILSYFDPSVLMCKSVGDTDLDFCTNAEFNQLDEQELSDFEFKQLSEGIRNCLSSTLSNLYSKSKGTELAQTEKNLNGNDVLKKENNTFTEQVKSFKLSDIFEDISKYKYIMNLLVEKQYCQPNTYIWKDEKKGNKGFLVAIIKCLHIQRYYKDNKRLKNEQIKIISKNTFGCEMSIDTIKKANPERFDISFIPPASTVN